MMNYSLKKEESHRFVKRYIEDNDKIIVTYGNGEKVTYENTDTIKNKLNSIEERQVVEYDDRPYKLSDLVSDTFINLIKAFGTSLAVGFVVGLFFQSSVFIIKSYLLFFVAAHITAVIPTVKGIIKHIDFLKYNKFLKNKDYINKRLREDASNEYEVENDNHLNPVIKPKKVKDLCINDANFMNHFQVYNLANSSRKRFVDRQVALERCSDLGITNQSGKVLTKTKK